MCDMCICISWNALLYIKNLFDNILNIHIIIASIDAYLAQVFSLVSPICVELFLLPLISDSHVW